MLRFLPALLLLAPADETAYYVGHADKHVNISIESQADLETIVGSTNKASGEIKVDFEKGTGSVDLSVPVMSLKTGIDLRDEHLQSADWLDAKKFPDIRFQSKKVKKLEKNQFEVTGEFTMHGVAKELTVTVDWREIPADLAKKARFPDGKWLKFSTEFKVKLADHGVKIPGVGVGKVSETWTVKMSIFAGTAKPEKK